MVRQRKVFAVNQGLAVNFLFVEEADRFEEVSAYEVAETALVNERVWAVNPPQIEVVHFETVVAQSSGWEAQSLGSEVARNFDSEAVRSSG